MTALAKESLSSSARTFPGRTYDARSIGRSSRTIGICGIGLIGASIAERLKRKTRKTRIVGYDKKRVIESALTENLIDSAVTSPAQMLQGCDIVVLSAPPSVNLSLLSRLSRTKGASDAIIVDTGSTQKTISDLAERLVWRNSAEFIAGHPMAGKELGGLENRSAEMFCGHPFFLDSSVNLSDAKLGLLLWFVDKLGSHPVFVESARHDRVMADVSHLPQLVSTVMADLVQKYDEKTINLAGSGLQSMIRLGGSPFNIWRDVFSENRDSVLASLDSLISQLQEARNAIANKTVDRTFGPWFRRAKRSYRCLW